MLRVLLLPVLALLVTGCAASERIEPVPTSSSTTAAAPAFDDTQGAVVGSGSTLVATLGDSITAGTPTWDPNPSTRAGYLAIGEHLDEQHQWQVWAAKAHPGLRFRNCGVNRQRTDEIEQRLAACIAGARVLVVQGGINDLAQGTGADRAVANLRAMVRAGKAAGLEVELVDVLPWNAGGPEFVQPIEDLNRAIHAMAEEEHVRVLPFNATLTDPDHPGQMRPDWTIDGSHPSTLGHQRLGELAFRLP